MIAFVIPGPLNQLTGGYIYDRHIVTGLRRRGHRVVVKQIARRGAARVLASIPDGAVVIVDGLAGGVLPREIEHEASRLRFVALVHHPLAYETGISKRDAVRLRASEMTTLRSVRHVVVTSAETGKLLSKQYAVAAKRISCIEPGTDHRRAVKRARGSELLCVGTLTPRKGHITLIRALARLVHLDWHLTCVGSLDRDRKTVARVRAEIRQGRLEDRVSLAGETRSHAALARHYGRSNLFVLPTEYEGYGMAVAEAIASGLPVVSTPTGAIRELVGDDAGILVTPGSVPALTTALETMLSDSAALEEFTKGAMRRRKQLPTWPQAVSKMAAVVRQVSAQ